MTLREFINIANNLNCKCSIYDADENYFFDGALEDIPEEFMNSSLEGWEVENNNIDLYIVME